MREGFKIILGGLWVLFLVLTSVWLLSLFKDEYYFSVVTLVWCFAFLGGMQFSSWWDWAKEFKRSVKK